MKKFFQEFKEFAMRGNVLDMAVGVVVGSAFTAIVTSIVQNLLTPLLGLLIPDSTFAEWAPGGFGIGRGHQLHHLLPHHGVRRVRAGQGREPSDREKEEGRGAEARTPQGPDDRGAAR